MFDLNDPNAKGMLPLFLGMSILRGNQPSQQPPSVGVGLGHGLQQWMEWNQATQEQARQLQLAEEERKRKQTLAHRQDIEWGWKEQDRVA